LEAGELLPHFKSIVGYEEVHLRKQKPEPDGLLTCLERLTGFRPGCVLYIGDHETDVLCALNANLELQRNHSGVRVMSIGAFYGSNTNAADWSVEPDFKATRVKDIIDIVTSDL
jgi:phosphoglycolate phosphatase-like HAD superfamily hydrolase